MSERSNDPSRIPFNAVAEITLMLKKILIGLALLLVAAVVAVPAYFYGLYPKMRPAPQMQAPKTPEAIERGRYLAEAMAGCIACHSPVDESRAGEFAQSGHEYSGRVFPRGSGFPGKLAARNLTSDRETGIGAWTDGEIVRAIREGVGRDGRPLFPLMNYPGYRMLSDQDALAIVAYLRTRQPISRDNGRTELDFPVGMMIRTVPQPLDQPAPGLPAAGIERGRAMITLLLCGECHTPRDERGNPVSGKELAGGTEFKGPWGTVYAANITSHPSAGIGAYSNDDLKRVFREGRNRAGRELWVMPWSITRNLTDEDLDSLVAAVREIAARPNLVPAPALNRRP